MQSSQGMPTPGVAGAKARVRPKLIGSLVETAVRNNELCGGSHACHAVGRTRSGPKPPTGARSGLFRCPRPALGCQKGPKLAKGGALQPTGRCARGPVRPLCHTAWQRSTVGHRRPGLAPSRVCCRVVLGSRSQPKMAHVPQNGTPKWPTHIRFRTLVPTDRVCRCHTSVPGVLGSRTQNRLASAATAGSSIL